MTAQIYEAMRGVMQDIGAIAKAHNNLEQRYKFRGIDDVYTALQPALLKHGVCIIPDVQEVTREERPTKTGGRLIWTTVRVKYAFIAASDGSSVVASIVGEGMDPGDKSLNKAMSSAYKNVIFQAFCVPCESVDSEGDNPKVGDKPAPRQRPTVKGTGAAVAAAREESGKLTPERRNKAAQYIDLFGMDNSAQLEAWCVELSIPRNIPIVGWTNAQLIAVGKRIKKIEDADSAGAALPSTNAVPSGPLLCRLCGEPMNDLRSRGGKVAFKCSKSDFDGQQENGCGGVVWATMVAKHPDQYPAEKEEQG